MENKRTKKKVVLLPKYFKIIGFAVIILALVPPVIVKFMDIEIIQSQKEFFRLMTFNLIILGLFFIAISRDKTEDELTIIIRLKAMAFAFSWAVLYVIIKPFVDLFFKDPPQDLTGQGIVMSMLFVYMIIYYILKKGR